MSIDARVGSILRPDKLVSPERAAAIVEEFAAWCASHDGPNHHTWMQIANPEWYVEGEELYGCQIFQVDTCSPAFGSNYRRGSWPDIEKIIRWCRQHIGPEVVYGSDEDEPGSGLPADDELLKAHRAAWVDHVRRRALDPDYWNKLSASERWDLGKQPTPPLKKAVTALVTRFHDGARSADDLADLADELRELGYRFKPGPPALIQNEPGQPSDDEFTGKILTGGWQTDLN